MNVALIVANEENEKGLLECDLNELVRAPKSQLFRVSFWDSRGNLEAVASLRKEQLRIVSLSE